MGGGVVNNWRGSLATSTLNKTTPSGLGTLCLEPVGTGGGSMTECPVCGESVCTVAGTAPDGYRAQLCGHLVSEQYAVEFTSGGEGN